MFKPGTSVYKVNLYLPSSRLSGIVNWPNPSWRNPSFLATNRKARMPDPNPSERLAEIEARVEAATAGPWFAERFGFDADGRERWKVDQELGGYPSAVLAGVRAKADATAIAHARSDIPWLLEREKKLREALRKIEEGGTRRIRLLRRQGYPQRPDRVELSEAAQIAHQALADSGEASGEAG